VDPEIRPGLIERATSIDIIDRGKSKPPKCYFDSERDVVDWALRSVSDNDVEKFKEVVKENGKHGKAVHKSLDASIMDIADDIAYGIHDLEDVIALHLISERDFRKRVKKDVCSPFLDFLRLRCGELDPYEHFILSLFGDGNERKRCVSRLVGVMINAAILITKDGFDDPILRYRVGLLDDHQILLDKLQDVVVELVIKSPNVQHLEFKGQSMVIAVFDALASDPKLLLPQDAFKEYERGVEPFRAICDFVAGMTDAYLLRTFERLFSPRMGSIFDKL
jgi:dGTPase